MGLLIYRTADPSTAYSSNGTFTNPLTSTFDGIVGGTMTRRFYVRNDDTNKSYSGITLRPVVTSGDNIINGTNGFSWKLIVGDLQPVEDQWNLTSNANTITIPDIGTTLISDTSTYEPFWLRIIVPDSIPIKSYQGINLRISYTEILVP